MLNSHLNIAAKATEARAEAESGALNGHSLPRDPVEAALAVALTEAAKAGRFDVVAMLAKELEARRLAGSNVVGIGAQRRGRL